jgi:hypothetical protein
MKFIDTRYFFLYPAGHLGDTEVTFLVVLPFTQTIEDFLAAATGAAADALGVGVGVTFIEETLVEVCSKIFAFIVGLEKVKFVA